MHSSRMRTARLLSVAPSMHCWRVYLVTGDVYLVPVGGVPGPKGLYLVTGGASGPGGCPWSQGVYLVPGGVPGPRGGEPGPRGDVPGQGVPVQVHASMNRILDTRF